LGDVPYDIPNQKVFVVNAGDLRSCIGNGMRHDASVEGFIVAIIGNPPYNSPGKTGTGNTIWQLFTNKAIDEWLVDGGYLAYVHPPGCPF